MKKLHVLATILVLLFTQVVAENVNEQTARIVAQNFMLINSGSSILKSASPLSLIHTEYAELETGDTNESLACYYVFGLNPEGFIIVSGVDNGYPVLGYSGNGTFDPDNLAPATRVWMDNYKKQILESVREGYTADITVKQEWDTYKSGMPTKSALSNASVGPLLTTKWRQGGGYINALIPNKGYSGCVTVAMSQIMKFWNHPKRGDGFHSYLGAGYKEISADFGNTVYDWDVMPDVVTGPNPALALMTLHVAIGIETYFADSVNTLAAIACQYYNCAETALRSHFRYSDSVKAILKNDYSDPHWKNMIRKELDAGRPVLYSAKHISKDTTSLHAFVCEGYDGDYFYFNWGWSGSGDGKFLLSFLKPGKNFLYNIDHLAIIGIEPAKETRYNFVLSEFLQPTDTLIQYGQPLNISARVKNTGTKNFIGRFIAVAYDNNGKLIKQCDVVYNKKLQPGQSEDIVFNHQELTDLGPGKYKIFFYYQEDGGVWLNVPNNEKNNSSLNLTVTEPGNIELSSVIAIDPGNIVNQYQPFSVNLSLANLGKGKLVGRYELGLYNMKGELLEVLAEKEEKGLNPGAAANLVFNGYILKSEPGNYQLKVRYNPNNIGWKMPDVKVFANSAEIKVEATSIVKDAYENNDSMEEAYLLPVSFTGNTGKTATAGSSLHTLDDIDYYKIELPSGFSYLIYPGFSNTKVTFDQNTYSSDVKYTYTTNIKDWLRSANNGKRDTIWIANGGTVHFHVKREDRERPGTYLLDIMIVRSVYTDNSLIENDNSVNIYPNPANQHVIIDFGKFDASKAKIELVNITGRIVAHYETQDRPAQMSIPLNGYPEGLYLVRILSDSGHVVKKLVINH